jgi:hypothetical protein
VIISVALVVNALLDLVFLAGVMGVVQGVRAGQDVLRGWPRRW